MIASAFIALALASSATDLPVVAEEYSGVEKILDEALEKLVKAGTYTCQRDGAAAAIAPLEARFSSIESEAERLLGRRLNLQIWANSCRRSGDGSRFRTLLSRAERDLRKAARLLRNVS